MEKSIHYYLYNYNNSYAYDNSNIILHIPLAPDNVDYQAVQEWVKEGNKIEDAD